MYLNFSIIAPQIKIRSETVLVSFFSMWYVLQNLIPVIFILLSRMECAVVKNDLRFHVKVDLISVFVDHTYILSL